MCTTEIIPLSLECFVLCCNFILICKKLVLSPGFPRSNQKIRKPLLELFLTRHACIPNTVFDYFHVAAPSVLYLNTLDANIHNKNQPEFTLLAK